MKIILFSRSNSSPATEELSRIMLSIEHCGFDYAMNELLAKRLKDELGRKVEESKIYSGNYTEDGADSVMVCCGGDGTLLEGARRLCGAAIPVVGINSGRLGFLTSVSADGIESLLEEILNGGLRVEERTLLEVDGDFLDEPESSLALNEIALQRSSAGMISVESYVDSQMVATYHGDGVLLSTPTGSTAYSLSVGGPVVAPGCSCFVISPLAPHNLTMRPVVIPDSCEVLFRVHSRGDGAQLSIDNKTYQIDDGSEFRVRRAEKHIFLGVPHNISFYDALRKKMMWGVDIRG